MKREKRFKIDKCRSLIHRMKKKIQHETDIRHWFIKGIEYSRPENKFNISKFRTY